jgi:hypothetical protein
MVADPDAVQPAGLNFRGKTGDGFGPGSEEGVRGPDADLDVLHWPTCLPRCGSLTWLLLAVDIVDGLRDIVEQRLASQIAVEIDLDEISLALVTTL